MPIEVPIAEDFNPDFGNWPVSGDYHVAVVEIDEDGGKNGEMVVKFEVIAGTPDNQQGTKHTEFFAKSVKAFGRLHQFAIALGLITTDELKRLKDERRSPNYDFSSCLKKQLFLKLEDEEYQDKIRPKCGFGFYHPTDRRCASWVRNDAMLQQAGFNLPPRTQPPTSASPSAKRSTTTQPAKPAVDATDIPF